jgi:hypothetical protein
MIGLIRLLLLAYPRRWRKRYGHELEALSGDVGLSVPVAIDLVRSSLRQRASELRGPRRSGYRAGAAWRDPASTAWLAALLLAPTALFVTGSLLAYQAGVVPLRGVMDGAGAWLDGVGALNIVLTAAAPVSAMLALAPLASFDEQGAGRLRLVVAPRTANLVVAGAALAVTAILGWYGAGEIGVGG